MDDGLPKAGNGAGFADVPCVRYYRTIRSGVGADAAQIGYGINRVPVAPVMRRWLRALYDRLLESRVTDYETPGDGRERALIAHLAGRYLGLDELEPGHVALCNGSSEGISILMAMAGRRGMSAVLPLPLYFAFEQSAARHGVPVTGYYSMAGAFRGRRPDPARPAVVVDVAPNGVTGSWAALGRHRDHGGLLVVDHVFALPTYQPREEFLAALRSRVGDLGASAVLFTPSKDLSLPGLRCGVMITANTGLLDFLRADRFERGYSVPAGTARVCAAHLALLLVAFAAPRAVESLARDLRHRFAEAGLAFLTSAQVAEFRRYLSDLTADFRQSMELVEGCGFLQPVEGVPQPVAGYSGLRRLDRHFRDAAEFTQWIHWAGLAGLKLNPNYLFGGDPELWRELYPSQYSIRVNFSVRPAQIARDLALLQDLLAHPARYSPAGTSALLQTGRT